MEYILVHKPVGSLAPEVMKGTLAIAKQLRANPGAFVPGGKLVESYYAIGQQAIFCVWDAPTIDSMAPLMRNMSISGWNTEIVPVERSAVAIENIEKAMLAVQAMMTGK